MNTDRQRTIVKEASVSGVGLHTAKEVTVTFRPAEADSGINFIRRDINPKLLVKAGVENLIPQLRSPRRTSLGKDGVEIHTVEHLMAALAGLRIDNLNIEINNEEVPGLDGSSLNFLEALNEAGIKEQDKARSYYQIREPIFVEEDGGSIVILPAHDFRISYTLSYDHPLLKAEFMQIDVTPETFKDELAPSRTFCLEEEAEQLQEQGIGQGANYENTLVLGKSGVIKNKLRYEDEFIRHKIVDLLGDLYILGQPIKGHVIALKSGHSLNLKLVKKIDRERQRYAAAGVSAAGHLQGASELGVSEITKILPHREPFLFVDKIISLEKGKRAVGIKNVTINDYFFKGHFPGRPVMPGVLIIEAMAQVGGVMMLSAHENLGKIAYFMAADKVKFRKTVLPGDQLVLEADAVRVKPRTGLVHTRALVDGKIVAEADLKFVLAD
ncbi:bifunctional UDP-3-O-[3-hydroxymyristoyl] N-acetylglucosamine deacetylase/3-hydroxyacyl-ACP dehydratase [bacterium]|nr:MAG: bifunctional UDP-3-O-[3-hydroxymyristoyl] N-acetylglucosamine deacetylase/3-hydroxyacyl-ACP dehydratase [bacterium]